jgi:hypothetical protein
MLTIENIEKMVGYRMILHNFGLPPQMDDWECEKVIKFPDDSFLGAVAISEDEAYRFEYKATSGYDVPLENNLMDINSSVLGSHVSNIKLFAKALQMYSAEVLLSWAKDQRMI